MTTGRRRLMTAAGALGVATIITATQPAHFLEHTDLDPATVTLEGTGDIVRVPIVLRVDSPRDLGAKYGLLQVSIEGRPASPDTGGDSADSGDVEESYTLQVTLEDSCGGRQDQQLDATTDPRSSDDIDLDLEFGVASEADDWSCEQQGWGCRFDGDSCEAHATLIFELLEGSRASADWSASAHLETHAGFCGNPYEAAVLSLEAGEPEDGGA